MVIVVVLFKNSVHYYSKASQKEECIRKEYAALAFSFEIEHVNPRS